MKAGVVHAQKDIRYEEIETPVPGRGEVLINGKRAPVVGRVCMDQFMTDISDIGGVSVGDEVTLIGKDGCDIITADDIAELCGTIGYEIVCGISGRVPRIYIDKHKNIC